MVVGAVVVVPLVSAALVVNVGCGVMASFVIVGVDFCLPSFPILSFTVFVAPWSLHGDVVVFWVARQRQLLIPILGHA